MKIQLYSQGVKMKYAVLLLILLVGCTAESAVQNAPLQTQANTAAAVEVSEDVSYVIKLNENTVNPDKIIVEKGSIVTLDVFDFDNATDVFFVQSYGDEAIKEGKANMIFKADNEGTFSFGLRTRNIKGTLVVQ